MISLLKRLIDDQSADRDKNAPSASELAAAVLLTEIVLIDGQQSDTELQQSRQALKNLFNLTPSMIDELIGSALQETGEATSLHQFTTEINRVFSHQQKIVLITALWRVALADNILDKHEEHSIRRIADLIHLRHSEFIFCKQQAREQTKT